MYACTCTRSPDAHILHLAVASSSVASSERAGRQSKQSPQGPRGWRVCLYVTGVRVSRSWFGGALRRKERTKHPRWCHPKVPPVTPARDEPHRPPREPPRCSPQFFGSVSVQFSSFQVSSVQRAECALGGFSAPSVSQSGLVCWRSPVLPASHDAARLTGSDRRCSSEPHCHAESQHACAIAFDSRLALIFHFTARGMTAPRYLGGATQDNQG